MSKNRVTCYGLVVVNVKNERGFEDLDVRTKWNAWKRCDGGGDQKALSYNVVTPWTEDCTLFISIFEKPVLSLILFFVYDYYY